MKTRFFILILITIVLVFIFINVFIDKSITNNNALTLDSNVKEKDLGLKAITESVSKDAKISIYDDYLVESFLNGAEFNDILLSIRKAVDPFTYNDEQSMTHGFKVIDMIEQLGTARIRINDPLKFINFLEKEDIEFDVGRNAPLSTPKYPSSRILEAEESFSGTSMEWLGVNEDRKKAGSGVKVAILDTGIDAKHESLIGMRISEISLLDDDGSNLNLGHGSAIASVIAGQRNDFMGMAPSSEILSIRVLNENGEGDSFTVAKGIVTAVDQGADIINLSLGGFGSSSVMDNAIEYAKSKNVLLVSAVGNDGTQAVSYPASHNDVVAVTSVDANARVSSFSNFGPEVDISAPGVGIFTAWEDNEFVQSSGTSIATAFVTGALASELSRSPSLNKTEVLNALYTNADETEKPGMDIWSGRGVLNMRRVEQRDTPGIIDVAVVGYYFDPENLTNLGTAPFSVTIQNQGTSWIQSTNLKVNYKGLEKNFRIGNLNVGESRSEKLYFDSGVQNKDLHIRSEVSVINGTDQFPVNNKRESVLTLP